MGYIRSRKFCCCLPVRLGVLVMTICGAGFCGLGAYGGWMQVAEQRQRQTYTRPDLIALYVAASIYTLGALFSVFGFIGAVVKARGLVKAYATAIAFHLGFHIIAGSYYLYTLFKRTRANEISQCIQRANERLDRVGVDADDATRKLCETGFAVVKGISIAAFVLVCLIELYGCIIAFNYVGQLEEEHAAKPPKYGLTPAGPYAYHGVHDGSREGLVKQTPRHSHV